MREYEFLVNAQAKISWAQLGKHFSPIGTRPIIVLNRRLRTSLGRAFLEENKIDLNATLLEEHFGQFCSDVIPHELAHFVAYRVFGHAGHGREWRKVMRRIGLNPQTSYFLGE